MPLTLSGRHAAVWALLLIASLSMSACGAGTAVEDGAEKDRTFVEETTELTAAVTVARCLRGEPSDALARDARRWARHEDIPVKEAIPQARLDECYYPHLADLERELKNKEARTFAGFWVEYEPEYRYVFLFTSDGEETIRPYVEDEPYVRFVEARSSAEATLKEQRAAQDEASRMLDRLKVEHASATNVKKNRAEIYVKDKARVEATLRREGVRLPEHVIIVEGLCCPRLE